MSAAARVLAPVPALAAGDGALRLRPLDRDGLAQAPAGLRRAAGRPASWERAVMHLTAPERGAELLEALCWGLPPGERLRWTMLAARLAEVAGEEQPRSAALESAERWLRDGDDGLRRRAYRQAEAEGMSTPGALAALCAFVSGPSLAPEGAPERPPAPELGRRAAAGALLSSAAALGPAGLDAVNHIGLDLAQGRDGREAARRGLRHARGPTGSAPARGGAEA